MEYTFIHFAILGIYFGCICRKGEKEVVYRVIMVFK